MNFTLSIIGIIGGILCAIADMFLDIKGKDNIKLGTYKFIDSKWDEMSNWRFILSIILSMVAVPMYSMGIISLANQIGEAREGLGCALKLSIFVGAMGGFFIHTFACIMPLLFKDIRNNVSVEEADRILCNLFKVVSIPFITLYLILLLVPTGIICYSIMTGILQVPLWFVLLNPVVFQILGWILRAVKKDWFCDLPSICAASLGLAMFGVIGIVNLL